MSRRDMSKLDFFEQQARDHTRWLGAVTYPAAREMPQKSIPVQILEFLSDEVCIRRMTDDQVVHYIAMHLPKDVILAELARRKE